MKIKANNTINVNGFPFAGKLSCTLNQVLQAFPKGRMEGYEDDEKGFQGTEVGFITETGQRFYVYDPKKRVYIENTVSQERQGKTMKNTITETELKSILEQNKVYLRAKFDELAKSLGLEIVSLKVKRTETVDL